MQETVHLISLFTKNYPSDRTNFASYMVDMGGCDRSGCAALVGKSEGKGPRGTHRRR